jgi:3-deoxy-manno-octulosonate cytidylyltransferase (CMP-KDO synthetase)
VGSSLDAIAIIPARLASTRLPRKPLRAIAGKIMLERVYEAAKACRQLRDVIVATDSQEILDICRQRGWNARMTSPDCKSGTERVREVAQTEKADVYVNVQGDEPLARPEHLDALLKPMQRHTVEVSTVMTPCPEHDIENPNAVKVICDRNGRAIYFSRLPIPYDRDHAKTYRYMKHLGFYAYRKDALNRFYSWPESALERSERLEQHRFHENGTDIYVEETPFDTVGVDTEEDVKKVESILLKRT